MAMTKKEREKRILELEKQVEALKREEELDEEDEQAEQAEDEYNPKRKSSGQYTKILIVLVVIILLIDVISILYYFKPDFYKINPGTTGSAVKTNGKCNDGTLDGKCSKNKPYYCYNGELLKSAYNCGCPDGYKISFQDCVKVR